MRKNLLSFISGVILTSNTITGCLPVKTDSTLQSNDSSKHIVTQCLAPQGNGGNWAATIGWMSEQIQFRINSLKSPKESTVLNLHCISGGSSGSVSTALLMTIMTNKNLLGQDMTSKPLTIEQAQIVADTLKFIGFSLDLSFTQLTSFWTDFVKAKVGSTINNTGVMKSIARNFFRDKSPKWWSGEAVEPNTLIVDYATVLLIAKTISKADVYAKIQDHFNESDTAFLKKIGVENLIDISEFTGLVNHPIEESEDNKKRTEFFEKRSKIISDIAFNKVKSQFDRLAFLNRYNVGVKKDSKNSLLKSIIERPLSTGYCAIVMAAYYGTYEDINLDKAPSYDNLRPTIMCNKQTIEKIIESPLYQNHILMDHPFAKRFVFLESKNIRSAILTSIREPGLMRELAGNANEGDMEFLSIYDPQDDFEAHGSYTFKLRDTNLNPMTTKSKRKRTYIAVAGGFPDRRISAWANSYLLIDQIEAQGDKNAAAYYSVFGKPDKRSVDKFDTISIRNTFSDNAEEGRQNVNDWFAFQDAWCKTFANPFDQVGAYTETVAFNWDVTNLPAAQAGKSHYLISKAVNATRIQLSAHSHNENQNAAIVFDPNKNLLPVPTVAFSCIP